MGMKRAFSGSSNSFKIKFTKEKTKEKTQEKVKRKVKEKIKEKCPTLRPDLPSPKSCSFNWKRIKIDFIKFIKTVPKN
jgi:hypothetical protein